MNGEYLSNVRRTYLLALYGIAAFAGVRASLLPAGRQNVDVLLSLATGLLLALLIAVDSRIIGKPLPQTATWLVFFLWPVAAPACVIARRKLTGVRLVLGHAALLFAVYALVAGVAKWLAA